MMSAPKKDATIREEILMVPSMEWQETAQSKQTVIYSLKNLQNLESEVALDSLAEAQPKGLQEHWHTTMQHN